MKDGLCPYCGALSLWTFERSNNRISATGGDYEWVEEDATALCSQCHQKIKTRIRIDLDSGSISRLVSSPLPIQEDWHCYVVAFAHKVMSDMHVDVVSFATDQAMSQEQLQNTTAVSYWAKPEILELSRDGYKQLDGTQIETGSDTLIHYYY